MLRFNHLLCGASLILFLCTASCSQTAELKTVEKITDISTTINLEKGQLIGTRGRDNARAWYGIPFAQAPIGDLRWKAPQPAPEWSGELLAVDQSSRCFQYSNDNEDVPSPGGLVGSEDCLHLNVWAPSQTTNEKLPVMFWIHGGGNVWGYANQYEMGRLAESQNVIVVSANYRLGPLGWFAAPSLVSTANNALDKSPNFGTLDLVAALDWTNTNIESFGGDPNNITVFGESAGGYNTVSLLASPLSQGKFHRAIIQSGGFKSVTLDEATNPTPTDLELKKGNSTGDIIKALEAKKLLGSQYQDQEQRAAQLRSISAKALFETTKSLSPDGEAFGGVSVLDNIADGIVLPKAGIMSEFNKEFPFGGIPIISGTNRDEVLGLGFLDKDMMNNFGNVVFWPKDEEYYLASGSYVNRFWRAASVDTPASKLTANQKYPIFTYRFDWDEQGKAGLTNIGKLVGASHALEIAFVTGGFDDPVNDQMKLAFKKQNKNGREALSEVMMSYWAEFAYSGSPGKGRDGTLPLWSAWVPEAGNPKSIIFDTEPGGGIRMSPIHDTPEDLFEEIRNDPILMKDGRRCKVAQNAMFIIIRTVENPAKHKAAADKICEEFPLEK